MRLFYVTRPMHFVYIVRCADGSLYTGYALDPRARIRVHNTGRGARYTSGRRPVRLVYLRIVRDAVRGAETRVRAEAVAPGEEAGAHQAHATDRH